jgi:hypothetical protein
LWTKKKLDLKKLKMVPKYSNKLEEGNFLPGPQFLYG